MTDPNRTQMVSPPSVDANRTIMGAAPTINATQTIKPIQCPICKSFNPVGVMFCVECGLIFDRALPDDAFGAPAVQMPVVMDGDGREFTLRPGENVLGRQGDLVFDDPRVSRRHAVITVGPDGMTVADLGSTNGTKLDGNRLEPDVPQPINELAKISLGGLELTVNWPGSVAKTAMPMGGKTVGIAAPSLLSKFRILWEGHQIGLKPGYNTVGRKAENDVVISDPTVSGKHATLEVRDDQLILTDLGSTNGTSINDAKVGAHQPNTVSAVDVLRFGGVEVRIEKGGAD